MNFTLPEKTKNSIPNIIALLSIIVIFFIGIFLVRNTYLITPQINLISEDTIPSSYTGWIDSTSIIEKWDVTDDNKINILITGMGGWNHDAPNLTDTIILASIHKVYKTISLLSIPRDLWVEYDATHTGKINEVFRRESKKNESPAEWMLALEKVITKITGENIDYYGNIDFNGFIEIIDTLEWVELTLEEPFIDYDFPDGNGWQRTFVIRKWTWTLNGETALNYARSRQSTSDFDRSLRQQQIIEGIKEKVSETSFLSSPGKIKNFYNIFKEFVFTNIELTDILELSWIAKEMKEYRIIRHNINDSCFYGSDACQPGWFLYVPEREYFDNKSVLLIDGTHVNKLSDYSLIHSYMDLIFNYPLFYTENFFINVFNSTKIDNLASTYTNSIIRYGFTLPIKNSIWNTAQNYETSIIYYNNISPDSTTLKILKWFFPWKYIQTIEPLYSNSSDTKIEIILWNDHADVFNF